eukprot:TRINITY_DN2415_c0_g1_i1.p1 TRINITY_DN2415_c0_g1~~TRINITY_DN2415_c0_g1_i1.p1  ORF type:complete len:153 (-),score=4.00 TRINITY_DN2415_c0_g1_i1:58-516(-)
MNVTLEKPMTWSEVVQIIQDKQYEKFGRFPDDLRFYDKCMNTLREEWESVGDHILHREFGFSVEIINNKKRTKLPGQLPELFSFSVNDFRYALDPTIEHHLIWSTFELKESHIKTILEKNRSGYECVYFVNPPAIRTVQSVHHVHVISRKKN